MARTATVQNEEQRPSPARWQLPRWCSSTPRLLVPLLLLTATGAAGSEPGRARGPATAPVLVELFTSEGCSSCPPADALLAELARGRSGGAPVVALSEHVDYWDELGWRDPFSSSVFTDRQQAYARTLRRPSIYTPQLVVSGRREVLGSDREAVTSAIAAAAGEASGVVTLRLVADARATVSIDVDASWRGGTAADVLVAIVQDRAVTRVARGENAGRVLEHVSVVRSLSTAGHGVGAFSGRATLRRADVAGAGHVVVFVQEAGGGPVHAAGALALP